ncbi:MAG: hypothetical protein NVS1B11_08240 [Terriglobales bacterium]
MSASLAFGRSITSLAGPSSFSILGMTGALETISTIVSSWLEETLTEVTAASVALQTRLATITKRIAGIEAVGEGNFISNRELTEQYHWHVMGRSGFVNTA